MMKSKLHSDKEKGVTRLPRKKECQETLASDFAKRSSERTVPETKTSSGEEQGLFLMGEVSDRVKKNITAQGMDVEVVTYTISCNDRQRYYVDDFDPEKYFLVGENVFIPVYVKPYKKKNGEASYMLKIQKKDVFAASRGERF